MKRNSKSRVNNTKLYRAMDAYFDDDDSEARKICDAAGIFYPPQEDTRYYGVFSAGNLARYIKNKRIKVDPKRYAKHFPLSDTMKIVMSKRNGHYFKPAKSNYFDYKCNNIVSRIADIKKDWTEIFLPRINTELGKIKAKEYTTGDDYLFQTGVLDVDEAFINASMKNMRAQMEASEKRYKVYLSLYSQFFHQMASSIEAATVEIMTLGGYKEERFYRNKFYEFKGMSQQRIKELGGFIAYDKMYLIWHFIKHNSISTYSSLKTNYPDALVKFKDEKKEGNVYKQGNLAIFYVDFNEALINDSLSGIELFFKNYCRLVFKEDYETAQWNYDGYFLDNVDAEIECLRNPSGLPDWV